MLVVYNLFQYILDIKYIYRIYIYIYIYILTACVAQWLIILKASYKQAVGHGFEPRPDH